MDSNKQNKWDLRFIQMAELVATWNKFEATKVGAVIVDPEFRVISTGFNGFPSGVVDQKINNRERKLMRTIHAEVNSILFARRDLTGCSIYVNYPPCACCTAKIIQVGIKRIVHTLPSDSFFEKWDESIVESHLLISEAGITLKILDGERLVYVK